MKLETWFDKFFELSFENDLVVKWNNLKLNISNSNLINVPLGASLSHLIY